MSSLQLALSPRLQLALASLHRVYLLPHTSSQFHLFSFPMNLPDPIILLINQIRDHTINRKSIIYMEHLRSGLCFEQQVC